MFLLFKSAMIMSICGKSSWGESLYLCPSSYHPQIYTKNWLISFLVGRFLIADIVYAQARWHLFLKAWKSPETIVHFELYKPCTQTQTSSCVVNAVWKPGYRNRPKARASRRATKWFTCTWTDCWCRFSWGFTNPNKNRSSRISNATNLWKRRSFSFWNR